MIQDFTTVKRQVLRIQSTPSKTFPLKIYYIFTGYIN